MPLNPTYHAAPIWLELPHGYADEVRPASFPKQILRYRNQAWAQKVGLGGLTDPEWQEHFCDFKPLPQNLPKPLALRYHGHQFTHYNPDLGDGRGFLFAQLRDDRGRVLDLGTKGSGQTPYSRKGDGRLTLKGAMREALATAYLEYQGINTSKTFSVFETGEELIRYDEPSPTRSAVLVRLSQSHVRFGTFQRLAYLKETDKIKTLISYCLKHYYPEESEETFFTAVSREVAKTTAQWMVHGFVHGVLNTDNINITGESFDYGPYRFLPHYDLKFTAAYFDHDGLYAFGRQPQMILWNLERLHEALQSVYETEEVFLKGYETYKQVLEEQVFLTFAKKLGLEAVISEDIKNLFYTSLQFLQKSKVPFEAFHHHLYCWHQDLSYPLRNLDSRYQGEEIEGIEQSLARLTRGTAAPEKSPGQFETLLIDEIEGIWDPIAKKDDWTLFNQKIDRLKLN